MRAVKLSIGKLRGLQQISTPDGFILLAAMDHRGALKRMLNPENPKAVSDEDMVRFKLDLCRALAPHASAVLLDPEYGAAQCIAAGVLPGHVGLLVSLEKTGYTGSDTERITELLDNWGPEKLKKMGASGAKLLVYYHPDSPVAARQRELVQRVGEECRKWDLLFVLEAVSYPLVPGQSKSSEEFARTKPEVVIRTARELTGLGCDVFKAEFPADLKFEKDEARLYEYCRQLDQASQVPWVILSEGVDYDDFVREVEIASRAGASGYMAGRAVWKDVLAERDPDRRRELLESRAAGNLRKLAIIASRLGTPWTRRLGEPSRQLAASLSSTWYSAYQGG